MSQRLQDLDGEAAEQYARAAQALAAGKPRDAEPLLRSLRERYPQQPDVLHLHAGVCARLGDHAGAIAAVRRALDARPQDATFMCTLGVQLAATGQLDDAIDTLQRACAAQPGLAMAWYNLGVLQVRAVQFENAITALRRACELQPGNLPAKLQLADLMQTAGQSQAAAAAYREVLAARPASGDAWWGLARLPTGGLGNNDIPVMQATLHDPRANERDRIALGFAMAKVLDAETRYPEALGVLAETHAHARKLQPWDAQAFGRGLDAILAAFTAPASPPADAELGRGAIFIVSLPRSGSTLTEQILASHPDVEGAGELHDLPQVLMEESRLRGRHYPDWVATLQPADWQRLGERYLERTVRWRRRKPRFIDKLPGNWLHVGAIRAMLPAAKVIVCRRDPVETCLSCYRQYMTANGQGWVHRFEDLGVYWNAFDRAVRQWSQQLPGFVCALSHEDLLSDPELCVRALLEFCGLPFDQACLDFHTNPRVVRSPSAAQVREPLHATARAPRYGTLLNPLRDALGFVDIMSGH